MLIKVLIWIMRFVLLGLIYVFLYKVIKVMYNDIKGGRSKEKLSAGIEVVETDKQCSVPIGAVYPLRTVTSFGRASDNDVVLDSEYISNRHARIYLKNNVYVLKDTGSTNGTFLNGTRIDKPEVIKNGDTIRIGGVVFKVMD